MEKIINPVVDLLKTYAFEGGISGIVIGAFLFFGIAYVIYVVVSGGDVSGILKLYLILFFCVGIIAIVAGVYGVSAWKEISGSRLTDKSWAVQLETDDTIKDALISKKRFESLYSNLVIFLNRSSPSDPPKFHIFSLYSNKIEAENGTIMAHDNWEKLGYDVGQGNSASTKDLHELCRKFVASDDGKYFVCSDE